MVVNLSIRLLRERGGGVDKDKVKGRKREEKEKRIAKSKVGAGEIASPLF